MESLVQDILNDFRRRVAGRLPLNQMVLFGSRARGDAEPDSDMDVLVVLEIAVDDATQSAVSECAWEACVGKGILLSPVVVSRQDWEDGPLSASLLALAVQREGIPA